MGCFTGRRAGAATPGKVDDDDLLGTVTSSTSTAAFVHSCVSFDQLNPVKNRLPDESQAP